MLSFDINFDRYLAASYIVYRAFDVLQYPLASPVYVLCEVAGSLGSVYSYTQPFHMLFNIIDNRT